MQKADIVTKIMICQNNFTLLTIFAKCSTVDVWQGSEYASSSDYASGSEYTRVTQGSEYLDIPEWFLDLPDYAWICMIMPEYVWIHPDLSGWLLQSLACWNVWLLILMK